MSPHSWSGSCRSPGGGRSMTPAAEPGSANCSRRERREPPGEVIAPALREDVESRGAPQPLDVVAVAGEEARDLRHSEATRVSGHLDDRIARRDVALARHREVEAEKPALEELRHEGVPPHPDAELEAREPRLGHDELRRPHTEAVADAQLRVHDALRGVVIAEGARPEL